MEQLTVVVGGQAGSEGKGAVTARLHHERNYDWAVRVGGPNAGHTVVDVTGQRFALRQLPVAAVADPECELVIAAGSEVDPRVLRDEIDLVEAAGIPVKERLLVDNEATLLLPEYAEVEKAIKTGTTGKGIGAARAARAIRKAARVGDQPEMRMHTTDTQQLLRERMLDGETVMIEGTQGYALGSHAGHYPYCTSGDCKAIDFLAAAGLPPQDVETWVVLRTYPIRIAGDSGPLPHETTWEAVGVEPEYTTVTKKVRRVGKWDWAWAEASVEAHHTPKRSPFIALTFADYWWPKLATVQGDLTTVTLGAEVYDRMEDIEKRLGAPVRMLGTGPRTQILIGGLE